MTTPAILFDEAAFCRPGLLSVVAAAPAVASLVTGAFTTTTDVEVRMPPSGAVV